MPGSCGAPVLCRLLHAPAGQPAPAQHRNCRAPTPCRVLLVGLNVLLTYLNYRGLHIVGNVAIATAVFTLLPFVVIVGLGELGGG